MSGCGCGADSVFKAGTHSFGEGAYPSLPTRLSFADRLGSLRMRLDIGRSRYSVPAGLYAVGTPDADSNVFVTANYKMSVDSLRRELEGMNAWVLVLNTRGINVWCAAGKGTFGTKELTGRIALTGLGNVVRHRTLILPQLGAPGVSAPAVLKATGFTVKYGPVRARDIPAFLANGMKKDDAMRRVGFGLRDRLAVSGVELVHSWPFLAAALALAFVFSLPLDGGIIQRMIRRFLPYGCAVIAAAVLFPALLPVLPARAFSIKGAVLGAAWSIAAALIWGMGAVEGIGAGLIITPVVSFIAMNFTGTTTFTCQKGAELEVQRGLLPMGIALVAGLALSALSRFAGI